MSVAPRPDRTAPQWGRFEQAFTSSYRYENALQDVDLAVIFYSPSGQQIAVDGFWDGGNTWRVRLMPDEQGHWRYMTSCSDASNLGLHGLEGSFWCGAPDLATPFGRHGRLRLSANRRYFVHADGVPFFWLADTCWAGPMMSSTEEWEDYLRVRAAQRFNAVQLMAMRSIAAPYGDRNGAMGFSGTQRVAVNAGFFQRMDAKIDAINRVGMLAVPALLWAAEWSTPEVNATNPGSWLPEDQAVRLARYIVARWGAHHVVWILPGDDHYTGARAPRWQRIGRGVFDNPRHAPVTLHPGGRHWYAADFRHEAWLDLIGYQSCHFGADDWLDWHVNGDPAADWQSTPARPIINIEPCYEQHVDQSDLTRRFTPFDVRRAVYWSLLVSPTAGVTYGGHGVWGWDDGVRPPIHHPKTGVPLPWRQALEMPGAYQMAHVAELFGAIEWWRLLPAPELLVEQPGTEQVGQTVVAACTEEGDLAVVYTPGTPALAVNRARIQPGVATWWFNPRTGERTLAHAVEDRYPVPQAGEDFVLVFGGG